MQRNQRQTAKRSSKEPRWYNLKDTASLLGVPYQTLRFWIKKRWITPQLDYRNKPVFTQSGIQEIRRWRSTLRPMTHA